MNKEGVETGELSNEALIGFVEAVRWLGYSVPDENAFLQKCQEEQELEFLTQKHGRLLCVVDCEGCELELLTSAFIQRYGHASDFIIECHDVFLPGATEEIQNWFTNSHEVKVVKAGARDPNSFEVLRSYTDMERWLAVSEMRPCVMHWIVCEARIPGFGTD